MTPTDVLLGRGTFDVVTGHEAEPRGMATEVRAPEEPLRGIEKELVFGAYRVRAWSDAYLEDENGKYRWEGFLEILRFGLPVYTQGGDHFSLESDGQGTIAIGTDITGDGEPDLAVYQWSGGNHGGGTLRVFSIGDPFRLVVERHLPDGSRLTDIDGDGSWELVEADDSFGFWPISYGGAPRPEVVLRLRAGVYEPAPELMAKDCSAFAGWPQRALAVRGDSCWDEPEPLWQLAHPDLWCYPIDLWYANQADLAEEFLRLAWPPHVPGKGDFVAELRRAVESSRYWPVVADMNGLRARPPEPPHTEADPTSR